jgi:hypothetical protein
MTKRHPSPDAVFVFHEVVVIGVVDVVDDG